MQADTSFPLQFIYEHDLFSGLVSQRSFPDGSIVFHLKFEIGQYFFYYQNGQWRTVADFQPCRKFRTLVIKNLSSHLNTSPKRTKSIALKIAKNG